MRKDFNSKVGVDPYQSTKEVDEDEETHGEKTESAKLGKEDQFAQVVDS